MLAGQGQAGASGVYEFYRHDCRGLRGSGPEGQVIFEDLWDGEPGNRQPKFPERVVQHLAVKNKFLKRGLCRLMSYALYGRSDGYIGPADINYATTANPFAAFILCGNAPGYPADALVEWAESDMQYNAKIPPTSASAAGVGKRGLLLSKTTGTGIKRNSTAYVSGSPYRELEYTFFAQINTPAYATGIITPVAGSLLADTDYFTISDGINPAVLFEFDSDGTVTSGRVAVRYTAGDSAAQVQASIIYAINRVLLLYITASVGSGVNVNVTHDIGGTIGNVSMSENVGAGGFVVSGLTGGSDTTMETADEGVDNLPIKSVGMAAAVACGNGEASSSWGIRSILGIAPTFQGKNQRTFMHEGTGLHLYVTGETIGAVGTDGYVQSTNQELTLRTIATNARDRIIAASSYVEMANGAFSSADVGRHLDITGSGAGNNGRYKIATVTSATEVLLTTVLVGNEGNGFAGAVVEDCLGESAFDGHMASEGDSSDPKYGAVDIGFKWRSVTSSGPHMVGRVWTTARAVSGVRFFIPAGGLVNNTPDQFKIEYLPDGGSGTRPVDDAWTLVPGEDHTAGGQSSAIFNAGTYGYAHVFASPTPACLGIRISVMRASSNSDFAEIGELGIFSDTAGVSLSGDSIRFKLGGGAFKTFALADCSGVTNMTTLANIINAVVRGYGVEAVVSSLGYLWFRGTVAGNNAQVILDTIANGSTANTKLGFTDGGTQTGVTQSVRKYPSDALTIIYRMNLSGDLP